MHGEQPLRLVVAFGDDLEYFLIDGPRRLFAERSRARLESFQAVEVGILARRELDEAETLAHAPPRHHVSRERRGLLDVVLGTGRLRAVDDLLRGAAAEHADDPRAKVGLGVVVAIAVRALIRDA